MTNQTKQQGLTKALGLAALVILTGCSSVNSSATTPTIAPNPPTTTTTRPTTTSTAVSTTTQETLETEKEWVNLDVEWETPEQAVVGRYELYHLALLIAGGAPEADPEYATFDELGGKELLEDVRATLTGWRDRGIYFNNLKFEHNIRFFGDAIVVTEEEGSQVILQDCVLDMSEKVDLATGDVSPPVKRVDLLNVSMRFVGDEWVVYSVNPNSEDSDGYAECVAYGNETLLGWE